MKIRQILEEIKINLNAFKEVQQRAVVAEAIWESAR
jgi:hypothetical protein